MGLYQIHLKSSRLSSYAAFILSHIKLTEDKKVVSQLLGLMHDLNNSTHQQLQIDCNK
jgi:hypothetical protein